MPCNNQSYKTPAHKSTGRITSLNPGNNGGTVTALTKSDEKVTLVFTKQRAYPGFALHDDVTVKYVSNKNGTYFVIGVYQSKKVHRLPSLKASGRISTINHGVDGGVIAVLLDSGDNILVAFSKEKAYPGFALHDPVTVKYAPTKTGSFFAIGVYPQASKQVKKKTTGLVESISFDGRMIIKLDDTHRSVRVPFLTSEKHSPGDAVNVTYVDDELSPFVLLVKSNRVPVRCIQSRGSVVGLNSDGSGDVQLDDKTDDNNVITVSFGPNKVYPDCKIGDQVLVKYTANKLEYSTVSLRRFCHPKHGSGTIWSMNPDGSGIVKLLLEEADAKVDNSSLMVSFAADKVYSGCLIGDKVWVKYIVTNEATYALNINRYFDPKYSDGSIACINPDGSGLVKLLEEEGSDDDVIVSFAANKVYSECALGDKVWVKYIDTIEAKFALGVNRLTV